MRDLHILLAPDSFKGSLSSLQAAKCMEKRYTKSIFFRYYTNRAYRRRR